jgi:hypothetical protein
VKFCSEFGVSGNIAEDRASRGNNFRSSSSNDKSVISILENSNYKIVI